MSRLFLPNCLSKVFAVNRSHATLGVLPVAATAQNYRGNAKPTDSLDQAIATFQSSFSECTAATQNKLGIQFASLKQHQKAFLLFMQASERGHPLAQFNLGLCYENGKGVEKRLGQGCRVLQKCGSTGPGWCHVQPGCAVHGGWWGPFKRSSTINRTSLKELQKMACVKHSHT